MKPSIKVGVFYDATQMNENVFYSKENMFGPKLTLKEAVKSRKNYLDKIRVDCQTDELILKVKSLEQQINDLNKFIPDNEIKEEIKVVGLEYLTGHKLDLEKSIRLCNGLIEEALSDYNNYSRRYKDALEFLKQYDIIQ
jgi:hypothetical protein